MTVAKSAGPVPGAAIRPTAGIKSHGTANQLTFFESSIFSVAYAVINAEEFIPSISWLLVIVDDVQLISFALITQLYPDKLPWIGAIFAPVRWLSDYRAFSAVNVLALSMVFATFVLAAATAVAMRHQTKVPTAALRLLRLFLTVLTTIFSMPILFLFIGGLNCVSGNLHPFEVQCTAPPHIALLVFNVLGLVVFVPMLLICSLVLIDTNPKSDNPLARAHGQVDLTSSCIRVLLVAFGIFLTRVDSVSLWVYNALTVILLGYLSSRYISHQPYFTLSANMTRAGFAMGGSLAMLVGSIGHSAGMRQLGWTVALGGAGLGFIIGAGAANWFSSHVLTRTVGHWHEVVRRELEEQNLASPLPVEKTTAATMQKLVEKQAKERKSDSGKFGSKVKRSKSSGNQMSKDVSLPVIEVDEDKEQGKGISDSISPPEIKESRIVSTDNDSNVNDEDDSEHGMIVPKAIHARRRSSILQPAVFGSIQLRPKDADKMLTGMLMGSANEVLSAVRERQPKRRMRVFDSPLQVEVCLRIIRENPTEKQVTLGLQLLERGLVEFPQDPLLLLLASAYLISYYGADGAKAADALTRELNELSHRSVSMGLKFQLYCYDRAARDRGERILDRAALEALDLQVRRDHLKALCCIRDTWELVRTAESLNAVGIAIEALSKCGAAAEKSYNQLLARSPRDANVLRAYAQYLALVVGDSIRAHQVLELAEDIEGQEFKARNSQHHDSPRKGALGATASPVAISGDDLNARAPPALVDTTDNKNTHDNSPEGIQLTSGNNLRESYAPSNHSGGNSSRAKTQLRRTLADRIRRPLQTHWLIFLAWTLFLATLSAGFFFCLVFYDRTGEVIQRFTISRYARAAALESIEALRLMVYHSSPDRISGYPSAIDIIKTRTLPELIKYLPLVSQWEASEGATTTDYNRLSLPKFTPNSTNYVAVDLKANELVNLILQASQLATSFTRPGSFNATYWKNNMELLWITENLWPTVKGIKGLGLTKVDQYNGLMASNQSLLLVSMGGMYLSLVAVGVLASLLVINPYFSNEDMILRMLQRVPKRAIASMVSQAEEDVETYCEVVGLDDPESDLGVDIKRGTAAAGTAATSTWHRNTKYKVGLAIMMCVMGAITYCMFGVALGSNSLQGDIARLSHTSNRRYASTAWRVLSREYFQPVPALPTAVNIMNGRTLVKNLKKHHDDVKKDPASIDAIFPAVTIFPRDCSTPGSCGNITDDPEIGFTRAVASQPLNAELDRLIEVAGSVVDFMTLTANNATDMTTEAFTQWRLSLALSNDVVGRLSELHNLMYRRMMSTVEAGTAMCIILFVFSLASFVAALSLFYIVGIGPLSRQAQTITSLLYLIPTSVLKESPELQKFVESGALVLDVRGQ